MPKICNLCGGEVRYTSNAEIYGKEYGSGKCYICKSCHAYTGTHKPRPHEVLGLLADEKMRKGKIMCHDIFDSKWKDKQKKMRSNMYWWLAKRLGINIDDCHFGHFDIYMLRKAYRILLEIKDTPLQYNAKGWIINGIIEESEDT